ncbi:hypothetical protein WA1_51520 [Scytonema hofmannii PCC 7110]|uniref:Transglutaminase-like domain-containing protein n=1 Tax=Scytonema hofmannii PCC 7110 TaxID=128403 RepID=A0A139WQD0_9CYAN|nr:hypothetical protein [Scytonema hofmannii]KYC34628.1 hypothetical protein WA1_51520 [Scytonema hofmannii PCC 7110]
MKKKNLPANSPCEVLQTILAPYAAMKHLDCQDLARVIITVLAEIDIPYEVFVGRVSYQKWQSPKHIWIDIHGEMRIDFRLKHCTRLQADMISSKTMPYGVFNPYDFPEYVYRGDAIYMTVPPKPILEEILDPMRREPVDCSFY